MIIQRHATKCPCWTTNKAQQALEPNKQSVNYRAYYERFANRDIFLILHSLGYEQPSADTQAERWDKATNENAIAHAVVDSITGVTIQVLEWGMRGWHVGGANNNLSIGVEMCESDAIAYDREKSWLFTVKNAARAKQHCRTAYAGAVDTFAFLCKTFGLNPMTRILSHKEAHDRGIAGNHGDPEHYWSGLGIGYTMDGFRADVASLMQQSQPEPEPEPDPVGFLGFPDVSEGDWYADALAWAVEKKVILPSGKPFNPSFPLDKATAVVLLRRLWNSL